jgi:aldose 1-epimerase
MISKSLFGVTPDGKQVDLYRVVNSSGAELSVITYGAIIQSLKMPDGKGVFENVVLGFDQIEDYLTDRQYLGAIAGRYASRIANAKFTLGGVEYKLAQNDGRNHLHGGIKGFNRVVWNAEIISNDAFRLSYLSPDGEEGYPGNLHAHVTYKLTDENEVHVEVYASTDRNTIVNLVQHSYFNLSGRERNILEHLLKINASHYLRINNELMPTGEIYPVKNSPFDFTRPTSVGSRLQSSDEQLQNGRGYDHSWILDNPNSVIKEVAELSDEESGRRLHVFTDFPLLHIYSGNFLSGKFEHHGGICLETQQFPDTPNQPNFPANIIEPGKAFLHTTIFKFSCE